jgi:cytochrome c oxidase subunit 3
MAAAVTPPMTSERVAAAGAGADNHRIGTLIFLMAGVMLFAGLVAGYIVLRYAGPAWPAPGMPRLPVGLAGFNTAVIALSSVALWRAVRALRGLDAIGLRRGLFQAALLGVAFLALQGVQWSRLLSHGLGFAATTYGSTFYLLTGAHAAHALVGVGWLLAIALRQREPWVPEARRRGIESCALFWHFVGIVWAGLYVVLYLL